MVIKKRELLFSVIIVCVLLCLGLFISGKISYGAAQTAEKYATATIIEDHTHFRYGMNTDFGKDSPVTFDEIGNGYIYIEKVREDYTRHTRTVTKKDSNGNTYTETEVYYSWDYVSSEHLATDTIVFLGEPFSYGTISLPVRRLNLADAGVEIAACGICLDFYGEKENVGVGSITNMYAITDAILSDNIVKL